jgi:hypothetical protein
MVRADRFLTIVFWSAFVFTLALIGLGVWPSHLPDGFFNQILAFDGPAFGGAIVASLEFRQIELLGEARGWRRASLIAVAPFLCVFNLYFVHAGVERMLAAGGRTTAAREISRDRTPGHDKLDALVKAYDTLGGVNWNDTESIKAAQRLVNGECSGSLTVDGRTSPGSKTDIAVPGCRRDLESAITLLRASVLSAEAPEIVPAVGEWRVHAAALLWWALYSFGRVLYLRSGDGHARCAISVSKLTMPWRYPSRLISEPSRMAGLELAGRSPFGSDGRGFAERRRQSGETRRSTTGTRNRFGAPRVRSKHRGGGLNTPGSRQNCRRPSSLERIARISDRPSIAVNPTMPPACAEGFVRFEKKVLIC